MSNTYTKGSSGAPHQHARKRNFLMYKSIDSECLAHPGMKYQSLENFRKVLSEDFKGFGTCVAPGCCLTDDGTLFLWRGFRWDGASGAVDTADFMLGSAIHDALCYMMDNGTLPRFMWAAAAKEMYKVNRENGMPWARAKWTYWAVRFHGKRKWGV